MNVHEVSLFSVTVRDLCMLSNSSFKVIAHDHDEACAVGMRVAAGVKGGRAPWDMTDEEFARFSGDLKLAGWRLLDDAVSILLPFAETPNAK